MPPPERMDLYSLRRQIPSLTDTGRHTPSSPHPHNARWKKRGVDCLPASFGAPAHSGRTVRDRWRLVKGWYERWREPRSRWTSDAPQRRNEDSLGDKARRTCCPAGHEHPIVDNHKTGA